METRRLTYGLSCGRDRLGVNHLGREQRRRQLLGLLSRRGGCVGAALIRTLAVRVIGCGCYALRRLCDRGPVWRLALPLRGWHPRTRWLVQPGEFRALAWRRGRACRYERTKRRSSWGHFFRGRYLVCSSADDNDDNLGAGRNRAYENCRHAR